MKGDDEDSDGAPPQPRGTTSLRFFEWNARTNTSERSFDKLRVLLKNEFDKEIHSIRHSRRKLAAQLGLYTKSYDCCINNCMAFTGNAYFRRNCPYCKSPRFHETSAEGDEYFTDERQFASMTARATYSYLPIIPRLKLLYANKKWAKSMRYPTSLFEEPWDGIRDVWEGRIMKDLRLQGTLYCH